MDWQQFLLENWHIKFVCLVLIVAAWIDGKQLKVPNWITFPMVLSGLVYGACSGGWNGFVESLYGMTVGLACLLPLYSVGGMGAGDVKLMAGMGAWVGAALTWYAFCVSVIVGAIMAICMVAYRRDYAKHIANFFMIYFELITIRDPQKLFAIAKERKPTMLLLPYGIPICIGSIAYFAYAGLI
jgi:prepilin peptidase CpaA